MLNPNLVCCHITGFGDSGPYRDRPSFDFIAQAISGFMSVTGERDGPPLRAGPPIGDLVAGLYAALGCARRWCTIAAPAAATRSGPVSTTR